MNMPVLRAQSARSRRKWVAAFAVATLLGTVSQAAAVIRYVNVNLATGTNSGTSWANAFRGPDALHNALAAAVSGDDIYIAAGTYRTTNPVGNTDVADRHKTYTLKSGVDLFGGFPAMGNPALSDRNPELYPTILSGDLTPSGGSSLGWQAEYFNYTGPNPPTPPGANPVLTRIDNLINFGWNDSPGPGVNADKFSVRWSARLIVLTQGTYQFQTQCDDGERLWLDGRLIIDQWQDEPAFPAVTYTSGTYFLTAGLHDLAMEMYGGGGFESASMRMSVNGGAFTIPSGTNFVRANAYHVISATGASNVQIDGFTIRDGAANKPAVTVGGDFSDWFNGAMIYLGGGARISQFSTNIRFVDCKFLDNSAVTGGAAFVDNASSGPRALFRRCVFQDNRAYDQGGALSINFNAVDCKFINNRTEGGENSSLKYGGAVYAAGVSPTTLVRSTFIGNYCEQFGGAFLGANMNAYGCIFENNSGGQGGGAGFCDGPAVILGNCTFTGNAANLDASSNALYAGTHPISVQNCIIWNNNGVGGVNGPNINMQYSCVQGGFSGPSNTATNPQFVGGGDLTPTAELVVDRGNNTLLPLDTLDLDEDGNTTEVLPLDARGEFRQIDVGFRTDSTPGTAPRVDMGAFEMNACDVAPSAPDCDSDGLADECQLKQIPSRYAVQLDGVDDYVSVTSSANLVFGTGSSITLEAWVRPDDVVNGFATIITKGRTDGQETANYCLRQHYARLEFYYRDSANTTWHSYLLNADCLEAETWAHVAVTYTYGNAGSIQVYVNGSLASGSWSETGGNAAPSTPASALWLGASDGPLPDNVEERFAGAIDEVRIWRNARTLWQINSYKNRALTTLPPELVLYYRMNEGVGASCGNSAVGGANGTLQNGAAWFSIGGADCDGDDLIDSCLASQSLNGILESNDFRTSQLMTYVSMISAYGKPWTTGTSQTPRTMGTCMAGPNPPCDPAERYRGLLAIRTSGSVCFPIGGYVAPWRDAAREVLRFETMLGNEAIGDAIDPTIGLGNGVNSVNIDQYFCFQGIADESAGGGAINTFVEEELALLRGRAKANLVPPTDSDYPVYHRLPHNASGGTNGQIAYRSNYGVASQSEAQSKFPQGHGDAYGYFLTAMKSHLLAFRGNPNDPSATDSQFATLLITEQPQVMETVDPGAAGGGDTVDVAFQEVRDMIQAMGARARTAVRIVEATYRRDYQEGGAATTLTPTLYDSNTHRAWGTADWARRGALGAYLDWAVSNQLLPAPDSGQGEDLGEVHRFAVDEVGELAKVVREIQQRLDSAGAGLNPLGLMQNVVPFGLDPTGLGQFSGKSHYEQVRDASVDARNNAKQVLEWANQQAQRLRENDTDVNTFTNQAASFEADFANRLIDIFGYPSADDPADNDGIDNDGDGVIVNDPDDDAIEANQSPDLLNWSLSAQELAGLNWSARKAEGDIQLLVGDFKVAGLRLEEARGALHNLRRAIDVQTRLIEDLTGISSQLYEIHYNFGRDQVEFNDRIKDIENREEALDDNAKVLGYVSGVFGVLAQAAGSPNLAQGITVGVFGTIGQAVGFASEEMAAGQEAKRQGEIYDVEEERVRAIAMRDAQIAELEGQPNILEQKAELEGLIRQTPQLMINAHIAEENVAQALIRLNQLIQRGLRLVEERDRVRKVNAQQLQQYRYSDLSFRVFRNNALQQYKGFYDLAARYVFLAARAFAYEWNDRATVGTLLQNIYRNGSLSYLETVITNLNTLNTNNQFNTQPQPNHNKTFSLRYQMLGLQSVPAIHNVTWCPDVATDRLNMRANPPTCSEPIEHPFQTGDEVILATIPSSGPLPGGLSYDQIYYVHRINANAVTLHLFPADAQTGANPVDITNPGNPASVLNYIWFAHPEREFRAWVENQIVPKLEDITAVTDLIQRDPDRDSGPAIVIPFNSQIDNNNTFYGRPKGDLFGGENFPATDTIRIRNFTVHFPGSDGSIFGKSTVQCFLFSAGDSVLREVTNGPLLGKPRPWFVIDQWLPRPLLVGSQGATFGDIGQDTFNPWATTGIDSSGNRLNSIKRFQVFQVPLGNPHPNPSNWAWQFSLAGRSAWNTQWYLVIPGGQHGALTDSQKRSFLRQFIYASVNPNPVGNIGLKDIQLSIQAYKN